MHPLKSGIWNAALFYAAPEIYIFENFDVAPLPRILSLPQIG